MNEVAETEEESNVTSIGHNSKLDSERYVQLIKEYVECDATSKQMNTKRADIRAVIKEEFGEDTDAFKDVYQFVKKKRHEREGYKESYQRQYEALEKGDIGDIFAPLEASAQ